MNAKYDEVLHAIAQSQDGKSLNKKDKYSSFLLNILRDNSDIGNFSSERKCDTEEIADNIKYAISEFKKALKVVDKFN